MPVYRESVALRTLKADQLGAALDAGPGPGRIEFRTGTIPATADLAQSAPTGTPTYTVTLQKPSTSTATSGTETILDPASVTVSPGGDPTWARTMDSTGTVVSIGDVSVKPGGTTTNGVPAGTGTFQLDATLQAAGSNVDFGTITVTQG